MIFATNVAETSVTIPGIKYVVDTGKVKRRTFNAVTGYEILKVENISQAQAAQRAGRAGRDAPGVCYRLYTEAQLEKLDAYSKPEILRCSLASVVLQLIGIGIPDIRNFEFMDKPSDENMDQAIALLEKFKAIESKDSDYTVCLCARDCLRKQLTTRLFVEHS